MDPEQEAAAAKIAAAKKGKDGRKKAQAKKEQDAASAKIAAARKGKAQRREKDDQNKAAVAIQGRYRGKQSRQRMTESGKETQRFFTPAEVAAHDRADDLWVSCFGKVLDLTAIVQANRGVLVQPIIASAGTDISHWFDEKTRDPRMHIDPETELEVPFTPMGRFLHCPPAEPDASWSTDVETPWWKEKSYRLGKLTRKTRKVTLMNMLSRQEMTLEVCSEETLNEIKRRYKMYNAHADSYTWKRTDSKAVARVLEMRKTLDENGIPDDMPDFDALDIDEDFYTPVLHLYFSDDLTIA